MLLTRGLVQEFKRNNHSYTVDPGAEDLVKGLFLKMQLNLTEYFHPLSVTSAPFFHIHRLVQVLETDQDRAGWPDHGGALHALREAIATGAELHAVPSTSMQRCSVKTVTMGLAGAAREHLALTAASLGGVATDHVDERVAARTHRRFNTAQRCLESLAKEGNLIERVLSQGVPLFGVLDRLDCRTPVIVDGEQPANHLASSVGPASARFIMHILPLRDFESNWVRSYGRFHCDTEYKDLLLERHALAGASMRRFAALEIGAYLGGCSFWPLVHLSNSRAVAVEQFKPAVAAMVLTSAANRLGAEAFEAVHTCVSDEHAPLESALLQDGGVLQPAMIKAFGHENVAVAPRLLTSPIQPSPRRSLPQRCRSLDDVLTHHRSPSKSVDHHDAPPNRKRDTALRWDVMRVNTGGMELSILRSGIEMLRAGAVRTAVAVLTRGHSPDDCQQIASLLLAAGARLACAGQVVLKPSDVIRFCIAGQYAANLVADFSNHSGTGTS